MRNLEMNRKRLLADREFDVVVRSAVLWGAILSVPITVVTLPVLDVVLALAKGGGDRVWSALEMTGEDWEMIPSVLVVGIIAGLLVGLVWAIAWLASTRRLSLPRWTARWIAAVVATAVPTLVELPLDWPLALVQAVPILVLTLFIAPKRIGHEVA